MPRRDYTFVKATRADYPMLRGWLSEPHVMETWGDPDEELALIDAEIDGGDCQMHIVYDGDIPFAFIQNWGAHEAPVPHLKDLPIGTRAIDTLLGETSYLGKGHAKAYVRQYAGQLLAQGAPCVCTDPRLTNPRGLAMYRAAGFCDHAQRRCETNELVQILTFVPSSL